MPSWRLFGATWVACAVCAGGCTGLLGDFTTGGDSGGDDAGSEAGGIDAASPDVSATDAGPDVDTATDARDAAVEGGCGDGQLTCDGGCVSASDPHNCGACGKDCLGGACAGGVCRSYTITAGGPWFATDGVSVAWVTASGAFQAPVAGGAAIALYTNPSTCSIGGYAGQVAIAGGRVVWTGVCSGSANLLSLWSAAAGLANSAAIDPAPGNDVYFQLALDPGGASAFLVGSKVVWSCPFSGSSCTPILTSTAPTPDGSHGTVIATSGTDVVWTDENATVFASVNGTEVTVASSQPDPKSVATDGIYVYWANRGTPAGIFRTPIAAPTTPTPVVGGVSAAWLSTDGTNVYFTDGTTDVKYVPAAGGAAQILYSGASPAEVVAAGGGVFWSDQGNIEGVRFP